MAPLDFIDTTPPPDIEELAKVLESSPLLQAFMDTDPDALIKVMQGKNYPAGHILFREGDPCDKLYIIWTGKLAVIKESYEDTPTLLGYRGPGDIIGEMGFFENKPRSATVRVEEDSRLVEMSREAFQELLSNKPGLGMEILREVSARLRAADEQRTRASSSEKRLMEQISALSSEKARLEALQRYRQETTDLIVHDLRNPLAVIRNAVLMLRVSLQDKLQPDDEEIFDVIEAGIGRMSLLVDSLLDVDRMESGEAELQQTLCSPADMAARAVEQMGLLAKHANIELSLQLEDNLPAMMMDEARMGRVLANLLDNAIKFTPSGGKITLGVSREGEDVWFSVTDTGPGVPPEDRERIFERFSQAGSIGQRGKGFGLGLALCRAISEAHGGRIWVEDGPGGVGSRFVVAIPIRTG